MNGVLQINDLILIIKSDGTYIKNVQIYEANNAPKEEILAHSDDLASCDLIKSCKKQLREYFQGLRTSFDLPLSPEGSEFQKEVWSAIYKNLSFGNSWSYGELAMQVGGANYARAVGGALNKNPIPIIIPCHRILAKSGLGGFALGDKVKRILLGLENIAV